MSGAHFLYSCLVAVLSHPWEQELFFHGTHHMSGPRRFSFFDILRFGAFLAALVLHRS